MNIPFFRSRCPIVRDLLLARVTGSKARELPAFAGNHLIGCRSCREFSEALPLVDQFGPAWQSPEPPPGLALNTITLVRAHWPAPGRPGVTHQETRLIWTTGLSMAGAIAAVGLILADRIYPLARNAGLEHFVEVGVRIGILQVVGGAIVSIIVLAARAIRSSESEIQDRDDQHGAGRE